VPSFKVVPYAGGEGRLSKRRKGRKEILQELSQGQQERQQTLVQQGEGEGHVDATKVSKVLSRLLPEYKRLEELLQGLEELERALRA
jgi:hypothetical protein